MFLSVSLDKMYMVVGCALLIFMIWGNFAFGQQMAERNEVPKLKMNDGNYMPAVGFGTYLGFDGNGIMKSENKQLRDAVLTALETGFRHFDTASIYGTEAELGEAVNMKINSGDLKREDVFIATKLWNTHHKKEQVQPALRRSLKELGLDYVDLFLMHWPMGFNDDFSFTDTDYMETWQAMEEVQRLGLAKSIGVSNFNKEQLERLLKEGTVKPAALQIEVHLQHSQAELVKFAQSQGIVVTGYSPLGALTWSRAEQAKELRSGVEELAVKHNKTIAQVALRWQVERNIVPIPKSVNPGRMKQNIDIFDFKLSNDEMAKLNGYNQNVRYTLPSFWQDHPHYPYEKVAEPLPVMYSEMMIKSAPVL